MNTQSLRILSPLVGVAALALTLTACGADETVPPPAPAASSEAPSVEPSVSAPETPSSAPSSSAPSSAEPTPSTSESAAGATVTDERAEIDIDDQSGNGKTIEIQQVRLTSDSGFVAIYTRDNTLLGTVDVKAGTDSPSVKLDKTVPATGELNAVMFGDDGDGDFDPKTDPRVVEDDGDAVEEDFDYRLR
ncbi:MAG: hypothetical protein ABWX96_18400 [Propionibacteriaceae bacterium]